MKPTHEELLALALDEIDSDSERRALQDAISQDPELQAEFAEIESLSRDLTASLAAEPISPTLDPQRQAAIRILSSTILEPERRSWLPFLIPAGAIAAGVAALISMRLPYESAPSPATQISFQFPEATTEIEEPTPTEEIQEFAPAQPTPVSSTTAAATPSPLATPAPLFLDPTIDSLRLQTESTKSMLADSFTNNTPVFGGVATATGGYYTELDAYQSGGDDLAGTLTGNGSGRKAAALAGSLYGTQRAAEVSSESYNTLAEPDFASPRQAPLSTFSIDVDTASYTNVRRHLTSGKLPPPDAVRVEEMLNYFKYNYRGPGDKDPVIAVHADIASCPWEPANRLARVAVQSKSIAKDKRPRANLVFLVDVSGSMQPENKLPLVRKSLEALAGQLRDDDTVSIVTYAGSSEVVLKPTPASSKKQIIKAIRSLKSGGSTNGASGINLAYEQAAIKAGSFTTSRVILLTDGDFNVGVSSQSDLKKLIEDKAKSGVFLSVFGVGMGNLKDSTLETLSQNGNGQYGYIDSFREAQRVFVSELSGTLITVAKDVKLQVEFNPAKVGSYRLVGYENRKLANADFKNDKKDAGEMGAGHSVTALYEIVPSGGESAGLRYQAPPEAESTASNETLSVSVRYRDEATGERVEFSKQMVDEGLSSDEADADFRFASAVASFGMLLRDSKYKGQGNFDLVLELAAEGAGAAPDAEAGAERAEFIDLVRKASQLK